MMAEEEYTLDCPEDAFRSIRSLVADAYGNAVLMGGDRSRLRIGAGYLRMAAQQAGALADFVQAVGDTDHPRAQRAEILCAQIERDIGRYVELVADQGTGIAEVSAAISVIARREQAAQRAA
jgi:hypothetical protein